MDIYLTDRAIEFNARSQEFVDLYNDSWRRKINDSKKSIDNSFGEFFPLTWEIVSPIIGSSPDPLFKMPKNVWVDPLVLDLDGDGIEITSLASKVQFDTNGDGIKTGTAWVQADDGLLVWDRNGNGVIDSGRE